MILHDLFYVYNTIQTISLVDIDASYKERKLDLKNISELNIAETKRLLMFVFKIRLIHHLQHFSQNLKNHRILRID